MTPLAQIGRMLPPIAFGFLIAIIDSRKQGAAAEVYYLIAFVVLVPLFSVIRWLVTRWQIDGDTLRIETGLIRRDSRRLPLNRIQAVDIVRPVAARILGVSELRIRLAGSRSTDGRLAFLSEAHAAELRLRLLSGANDIVVPGAPSRTLVTEVPETLMARVPPGRLIASVLLSFVSLVLVATVTFLIILDGIDHKAAAAVTGALAVYLVSFAGVVWRRISGQFHFQALEAVDGVHIRRGLLQTVSETIPYGRIQAVRQFQPLLWRPLGWCRLEVDIAGAGPRKQRGEGTGVVRKALLPVGSLDEAWHMVVRLMGGPDPERTAPPRRARWKAPLSYHFLSAGHDATHAVCVTGRLNRTTTWVPLEKTQSIRRVQGPAQRLFGLATVHVDAAGSRTRGQFRDREVAEADDLVDELTELSRQARLTRKSAKPDPVLNAPTLPPAGWYPDPSGQHHWRYWDGSTWTDHVATGGTTSTDG